MSADPVDPAAAAEPTRHPSAASGLQAPTAGQGANLLPVARLCRTCDGGAFDFARTDELPGEEQAFGQERAVEALQFALSMRHEGYHAFVMGPPGSGRRYLVRRILKEVAATRPTPPDLVYVRQFVDARRPLALTLAPGEGPRLARDMETFVADMRVSMLAAFSSQAYITARMALERGLEQRNHEALAPARTRPRSSACTWWPRTRASPCRPWWTARCSAPRSGSSSRRSRWRPWRARPRRCATW